MKYKLINNKTKEETLCDKITIDGFDYYVSDEKPAKGEYFYNKIDDEIYGLAEGHEIVYNKELKWDFKIIATNNPNIDIPKVVDEVQELAKQEHAYNHKSVNEISFRLGFEEGYNKSQETHLFSEEDIIEFNVWQKSLLGSKNDNWLIKKSDKELLELWKEQQTKVIYYNE